MLNRAILMGRLVADPELRQTPNGISVCSFTIAIDRNYAKDRERQADFIDMAAERGICFAVFCQRQDDYCGGFDSDPPL